MLPAYYPRSFLKLLLLAFFAAALPLVAALVQASFQVDSLAKQSQRAVGQTARAARASRQLLEQTVALERAARQYLVLDDPTLLEDYATLRGRFKSTSSELSLLPLDDEQLRELNRTIDGEAALYDQLRKPHGADKVHLAESYGELTDAARGVQRISNDLIDREMDRLQDQAETTERLLWRQLPLMLLLGIGVSGLAAFYITRPLRRLEGAVRRLGDGDLESPVQVRGPADLESLGRRLDWLRRRLGELEAQKARFLRHVSHELKTPLTALREGTELLADGSMGALAEPQREVLGILQAKTRQLQTLIERLLNVQRSLDELGRLSPELLALDELVRRGAAEQRLAVEAHDLHFDEALAPLTVVGDRQKLSTVVDNLISNAIKHSPPGGMIALSLQRQGREAWLEVADQGPGVPAADREKIFDWFYLGRGGDPAPSPVPGSGLGLPIARELAEAHHGQLTLVSVAPEGARFRLTLPLSESRRP